MWRIVTTFLFFGTFGFNFLFNMIFTYRYCRYKAGLFHQKMLCFYPRMLEEGSFRGKSSDFVMMFLFGALSMITFAFFVNLLFLGQAFTIMLVYVWARRNPYIRWLQKTLLIIQTKSMRFQDEFLWSLDIQRPIPSLGSSWILSPLGQLCQCWPVRWRRYKINNL